MNGMNYSKFKDASPNDTIHKIRNILYGLGITTVDNWVESGIEGCYSLRVTIAGTSMGSNGKGTEPIYAMASAYAELIERLQNDIVYLGGLSIELINRAGFIISPDEKYFTYEEVAAMDNSMLSYVLPKTVESGLDNERGGLNFLNSKNKLELIKDWVVFNPPEKPSSVITVPFYSVKNNSIQYLIYDMYSSIYGSNGMCAGNTPEEAIVQGLSEIFERYVNKKLITDKITPPTIPDSYLMQHPGLYSIIQNIREGGRYKVLVKDCSLGEKIPVVGTIIIDTLKGTFGMKLGVHPSFDIALERTITEAFQGRNIEEFTKSCSIGFDESVLSHRDNFVNVEKIGTGYYPAQLMSDKFCYEFEPFMDGKYDSNKAMLKGMIKIIDELGYEMLIRDVSFLGFPSYQIIIPGFSEMYPVDMLRAKELKTYTAMSKSIGNLGTSSKEELERVVRYIKFKKYSQLENQMNLIMGRPFVKSLPGGFAEVDFLVAMCLYKLGKYDEAYQVLKNVIAIQRLVGKDDCYFSCMADFVKAKSVKLEKEDVASLIMNLYPVDIAKKVIYQLGDPDKVFDRIYPKFNCWNCEKCDAREYCCYREVEKVLNTLYDSFEKNPIDQEKLAEVFKGIQ